MSNGIVFLLIAIAITFVSPGLQTPTTTTPRPLPTVPTTKKGGTSYQKLTVPANPRRTANIPIVGAGTLSATPTIASYSRGSNQNAPIRVPPQPSANVHQQQTPLTNVQNILQTYQSGIMKGTCTKFQYELQPIKTVQFDASAVSTPNTGSFPDDSFNHADLQDESAVDAHLFCKPQPKNRCTVIINEVLPTVITNEGFSTHSFVELSQHCDRRQTNPINSLNGYIVVVLDLSKSANIDDAPYGTILLTADLSGKTFRPPSPSGSENSYFVIGSRNVNNVDLLIDGKNGPLYHIQNKSPNFLNAIPQEQPTPIAIMLLYVHVRHQRRPAQFKKILDQFKMEDRQNGNGAITVTESLKDFIKNHLVDLFVYGGACTDHHRNILHGFYSKFPDHCHDYISASSFKKELQSIESFSKCNSHSPFDGRSFVDSIPTPGEPNSCEPTHQPYDFTGKRLILSVQCKKLIANTWSSLWGAKHTPHLFDGPPLLVTSRITGLPYQTTKNIVKLHRANDINRKSTKRRSCCRTMIKVDGFDRSWIRDSIVKFYKANTAATAKQLYQAFLTYKEDDRKAKEILKVKNPQIDVPAPFYCSMWTFRRILHLLGFKFGKIDNRAAIIQRPDLVRWRGRYLKTIRDNAKLSETGGKSKKLIYLDETWIDSNMRVVKGWVPRKQDNYREMALYTYGTMKVGKGPRLIVLSAVTEYEVIKDSVEVYAVSKTESELQDYHKNVNHASFMTWFKRLLDTLERRRASTGDDFLIIMDNAPYHSKRTYPLKSDSKQTLYDWLKKYESDPELHFTLPPFKDIRKWELEVLLARVISQKKMSSELYEVDKLAKEKGFEILPNAPYHCFFSPIEYCWKDVKLEVRKQNVAQDPKTLKPIVEKILKEYPSNIMKNHFDHVRKLENQYWTEDGTFDDQNEILPVVINPGADSEDEEEVDTSTDFSQCEDFSTDRTTDDVEFESMEDAMLQENDEFIETDGTIHLDDGCSIEHGYEDEIAEYMKARPKKRVRMNPMCISQDLYM